MEIDDLSAAFADSTFARLPRVARPTAARCVGSSCPARRLFAQASSTSSSTRPSSSARRARLGARREAASELGAQGRGRGRDPAALAIAGAGPTDLLLMAAGKHEPTSKMLGQLRLQRREREICSTRTRSRSSGSVDFPLFEWDAEEKRHEFMHHPFTSPLESDAALLETDPGALARGLRPRAERQRDRRRQHPYPRPDVQRLIFRLLRISDEEAKTRFGFFLEALEYGTPPHGGIALGLDRVVAILCGERRSARSSRFRRRPRPWTSWRRAVDGQREAAAGAAPQETLNGGMRDKPAVDGARPC